MAFHFDTEAFEKLHPIVNGAVEELGLFHGIGCGKALGHGGAGLAGDDRQEMGLGAETLGQVGAFQQHVASVGAAVIGEQDGAVSHGLLPGWYPLNIASVAMEM